MHSNEMLNNLSTNAFIKQKFKNEMLQFSKPTLILVIANTCVKKVFLATRPSEPGVLKKKKKSARKRRERGVSER